MVATSKPSLVVRAYTRALRARGALIRRLTHETDGLWLGLLDPKALAEFDTLFFAQTKEYFAGRRARYVDDDWNDQGLFGWEAKVIADHFPPGGRIVVTSAGAGREVLALLKAGYDAVGYEPNAELCRGGEELLAARGYPGRLHQSARDSFPAGAPPCDAIVVGWGAYTNMAPRAARVAFLRAVHAHSADGGRVLLSYFSRAGDDEEHVRIAARAALVRRLLRRPPPEVGDALQPNFVHRFTEAEALGEIRDAGFDVVHSAATPYGHAVLERRG